MPQRRHCYDDGDGAAPHCRRAARDQGDGPRSPAAPAAEPGAEPAGGAAGPAPCCSPPWLPSPASRGLPLLLAPLRWRRAPPPPCLAEAGAVSVESTSASDARPAAAEAPPVVVDGGGWLRSMWVGVEDVRLLTCCWEAAGLSACEAASGRIRA
ncbi:hypothetical protein HYH03_012802 [Edaphochlamys debaryana]|uniref:Uncharacterized protein n=1 Tax=Edaphochlamys debaryana TaxID=47281 RepID=A0A836BV49_9CHLO|nr:hypothetical protein HYH03_012802 [Edaphochlamys debaryana]|eukprot:KAG2488634.1 hypothetical protein HYH03_012802 [Edaphochlamys debaryana]